MDNAAIHMYPELVTAIHSVGAMVIFLPPYSPELNPIEVSFGLLKRWIQRNANVVFPLCPDGVLEVAMRKCHDKDHDTSNNVALKLYKYCGYGIGGLCDDIFDRKSGILE